MHSEATSHEHVQAVTVQHTAAAHPIESIWCYRGAATQQWCQPTFHQKLRTSRWRKSFEETQTVPRAHGRADDHK